MSTALLVIDLQQGMFSGDAPPHDAPPHDGEAVLARVGDLIARARRAGIPVLHVRHDGGAGDVLGRDGRGWALHPAVAPRGDEPVIDKDRCSAFHGTDLHEQLQRRGITHLVIAGMQTEYCIDTNCRDAHGLGYRLTLASDGHTTFDTPELPASAVVAHHNRTLAQGGFVEALPVEAIAF